MTTRRPLLALLFAASAALLVLTGCDSNDPDDDFDEATPLVQFGTDALSAVGPSAAPVELPVTLTSDIEEPLTVEVLFAAGASSDITLADLLLDADDGEAYYTEDEDGNEVVAGYVVETVSFEAGDEEGTTRVVSVDLTEDLASGRKTAVFALQNATLGGERLPGRGASALLGSQRTLTLTLGTITLLDASFSGYEGDAEFPDPFTQVNLGGSAAWGLGERDDFETSPFAEANAFGAGAPSNAWLISDALDFTTTGTQTLTFLNAKNFDDGGLSDEALRVLVSTDYDGEGSPEDADWTDISDRVNYSEGGYETVSSGDVDLSDDAFQTEATYVAFQYVSSGTGAGSSELWRIDEISITGAD